MGQKRVKLFDETAKEKRQKVKKTEKKKVAKAPGLKGGQRVVLVESEPAPAEVEELKEAKKEKIRPEEPAARSGRAAKKRGQPGRGGRYRQAVTKIDPKLTYGLAEAISLVKETSTTRFKATVEAHLNLKRTAAGHRGTVKLPHGSGKRTKVLVFGDKTKGADLIGDEALLEKISQGQIPKVDVVLATPDWMPKLARVAKFLGPKGLMPNPKSGTVTKDPGQEIERINSGQVEFRAEAKAPIIHLAVGKADWEDKKLAENVQTLIEAVGVHLLTGVVLSSTMGPGVKVAFD